MRQNQARDTGYTHDMDSYKSAKGFKGRKAMHDADPGGETKYGISKKALGFKAHAFNWTDYIFLRLAFYTTRNPRYLRGWINRLIDLYKTAKGV